MHRFVVFLLVILLNVGVKNIPLVIIWKLQKRRMTNMFSTPDISHLRSSDYEHIYEPAEDSFLFLDSLEKEHDFLKSLRATVCLEIGCGSGIVSTFLSAMLKPHAALYLCSDINVKATKATLRTAKQNNTSVQPILTDLASCLLDRLKNTVDVILFNPPYVVTPSQEVGSKGIEASWAGGARGREVIDRFLKQMPRLLSPTGVCYLVIIKENDAEEIASILSQQGLNMELVMSRKSGPEHLSILKFTRNKLTVP